MNPQETVNELRRLELEVLEHEGAREERRRQSRGVLEVLARRPQKRSLLDREGRQRFLQQCGSASSKRSSA